MNHFIIVLQLLLIYKNVGKFNYLASSLTTIALNDFICDLNALKY